MKAKLIKVPERGDPPYWVRKEMLDLEFEVELGEKAQTIFKEAGFGNLEIKRSQYFVVMLPEVLRVLREKKLDDVLLWFESNAKFQKNGILVLERKYCMVLP